MGSVDSQPYYFDDQVTLWCGDALEVLRTLPDESVNCVVTSPPYYGLRDYGEPGQYGLEETPAAYVEKMRHVFAHVRRVLTGDGTLWLNLGDSYARGNGQGNSGGNLQGGSRPSFRRDGAAVVPTSRSGGLPNKNLLGIPWRVAFELQDDGWILRSDTVWHKPNAMPESVRDRPSSSHEFVFLFAKSSRYWYDVDAVDQPATGEAPGNIVFDYADRGNLLDGQSRRFGGNATSTLSRARERRRLTDVWSIPTQPFPAAHFAVMARDVAQRCILAGCRPGGTVLDPFCGSGTTGMVALKHGRRFVGIDLSAKYLDLALRTRLAQSALIDQVD